ncbi:MAG TPA: MBL fold metallo-hydrolase [Bryobacteraceae bacterium]|nr:MBL fold metallo-hydrolase [Bryobacteraceae bacterium]
MQSWSTRVASLVVAAIVAGSGVAAGQDVHLLPVRKNIWMLVGAGANIAVSAGPDGVLLVDAGTTAMTDKVLAAVRQLGSQLSVNGAPPKPIQFVINTSVDADHTGGNERIAKAGKTYTGGNVAGDLRGLGEADPEEGAQIYAYQSVLSRMSALGKDKKPVAAQGAWPAVTYDTDVLNFSHFVNGEAIQIIHQPAAHTDTDSMVYFRGSDVLVTGDIFTTTAYPAIDVERGGSLQGLIDGLNRILDIAIPEFRLEGGTMIIPGHGRLCDAADVAYYRDMVTVIRDRVKDQIAKGKTLAEVQEAGLTKDYDGRYGSPTAFIEAAYRSLKK